MEYKGSSLEELSVHLTDYSFVDGYDQSSRDVDIWNSIPAQDARRYISVNRWWRQISSTTRPECKEEVKQERKAEGKEQAREKKADQPEKKRNCCQQSGGDC